MEINMKTKIFAMLLALTMLLSLSSCAFLSVEQNQMHGPQNNPNANNGIHNGINNGNDNPADPWVDDPFDSDYAPPVEDASEGLNFTLNKDGDGYIVSGIGSCSDDVVVIPSKHEDKPVTEIGARAFYGNKGITEVVIPETVKVISGAAFNMCSLSRVTIPNSVEKIDGSAFNNCVNLNEIEIPDSVDEIGSLAFTGCPNLTKLIMPKTCHLVGSDILSGTPIYDDKNNWDGGIFYYQGYLLGTNREALSGNITIKSDTRVICSQAFERCAQVTGITVPVGVISIGSAAFGSCESLRTVSLPDTIDHLEDAFSGTPITDGVLDIVYVGNHVVSADVGGAVVIKDGTLTISSSAGLVPNSLTLPKSLSFIGKNAINLRNCESITYKGTKAEWEAITKMPSWDLDKTGYTIVCTDGTINK